MPWLVLFICVCFPLAAASNELRLDGTTLDVSLALSRELFQIQDSIDERLVPRLVKTRIFCWLRDPGREQVLQAICHSGACYWSSLQADRVFVSSDTRAALKQEPRPRLHAAGYGDGNPLLESCMRELMAPWLRHESCALAFHPRLGQWSSVFDVEGNARFRDYISLLGDPSRSLPSMVRDAPPAGTLAQALPVVRGRNGQELLDGLAAEVDISLSYTAAVAAMPVRPIALPPAATVADVPAWLRGHGMEADWIAGVLCCDRLPIRVRHSPCQSRVVGIISLSPFPGREEAVISAIRRRVEPDYWQSPEAVLRYLPYRQGLLIAAESRLVRRVLAICNSIEITGIIP